MRQNHTPGREVLAGWPEVLRTGDVQEILGVAQGGLPADCFRSASGCPGRPGLPDSQSRSGGVAGGWKSVLRFYSSSARKAVYPSYS